jgi:hypothetical protein
MGLWAVLESRKIVGNTIKIDNHPSGDPDAESG